VSIKFQGTTDFDVTEQKAWIENFDERFAFPLARPRPLSKKDSGPCRWADWETLKITWVRPYSWLHGPPAL